MFVYVPTTRTAGFVSCPAAGPLAVAHASTAFAARGNIDAAFFLTNSMDIENTYPGNRPILREYIGLSPSTAREMSCGKRPETLSHASGKHYARLGAITDLP